MKHSRVVGVGLALGLGCVLGPLACSAPAKGALVLAISTDMRTPKDVNIVSVFVSTNGTPKFDYLGRVLPDGTVAFPATLAIVEPDDPNASVRIRVTLFLEQTARVLRDVRTTVPHATTSLLRLPLSFLDDGSGVGQIPAALVPGGASGAPDGDTAFDAIKLKSSCGDFDTMGLTSVNGTCVKADVDSSQLPPYVPAEVYGDGGITANGPSSCFDVAACFKNAVQVTGVSTADAHGCTATLPASVQGTGVNLALVTSQTGECLSAGKCFVPLESDPADGFSVSGSTVHLIPGACAKLTPAGGAQLYAAAGACAPKTVADSVCEPTSAAAADAGINADAGSDAAAGCDGSYVITCASSGTCNGGQAQLTVSGNTGTLVVPADNSSGNGATGTQSLTATVDTTTCVVTAVKPANDGSSCDPGGTLTFDLRAGTTSGVPCGGNSPDGMCSKGMLSCTVAPGMIDGGFVSFAGDAGMGADTGSVGSTFVGGSVSGITLSPKDTGFAAGTIVNSDAGVSLPSTAVLAIVLTDSPGACAVQQQAIAGSDQKASSTQLAFAIEGADATPIGPGTYGINSGTTNSSNLGPGQTWNYASLTQASASCSFSPSTYTGGMPDSQATGGTLTISQVTSSYVAGSFNLSFATGSLSGTFTAPACGAGVDLQKLFTTNAASLGMAGPDPNGICYGFWGSSNASDAGALPDTQVPPFDSGGPGDDGGGPVDAMSDAPGDASFDGPTDGGLVADTGAGNDASSGSGCYLLPPGAVSWWRGEGNPNDVLGNNSAAWSGTQAYAPGVVGTGFTLTGSNYLMSGVTGVTGMTGGTLEGWVRVDGIPALAADLFGYSSATGALDGGFLATGLGSSWRPDFTLAGQTIQGVDEVTGPWVHLGLVWTPGASDAGDAGSGTDFFDVYVDGALVASMPLSVVDAGTPAGFLMGGEGSGSFLTGALDEITVYDAPLTSAQIQGIYAAGSAGKCQCMTATDCPSLHPTCQAGFCM